MLHPHLNHAGEQTQLKPLGVVLADVGLEDAEGIGAIAVFIGMSGNFIGETLKLWMFL